MDKKIEEREVYFINEEHINYFSNRVIYYRNLLNLKRYNLIIKVVDFNEDDNSLNNSFANCETFVKSFTCIIKINKRYSFGEQYRNKEETVKRQLDQFAFHEVCHLLTAKLFYASCCRFITTEEVEDAEEEIVRTLENCIFPLLSGCGDTDELLIE